MTPPVEIKSGKNWARLHLGDVRSVLPTLPDASVNCCVTSPPYFGLRDYGVAGQIGLEQTPDAYVAEMVAVFREVRRVLRDDGTLWLNLGDSFSSFRDSRCVEQTLSGEARGEPTSGANNRNPALLRSAGLKHKDLIGIPWRVAFALQADGWYLRSDIIWAKPNCMPESVTDRPTKSHEYLFLLSKSERYYYDHEAIKEPAIYGEHHAKYQGTYTRHKVEAMQNSGAVNGEQYQVGLQQAAVNPFFRNKRDVWTVAPAQFAEAHFATFPEALIDPCVKAGCPRDGVVLDPFNGSGTTAVVALKHDCNYIGVELNQTYLEMSERRIRAEANQRKMF